MTINRTLSSFLSEQSANASFDGGTLFIDAVNGRVGIGNTAPGSALTVTGTLSSTGALTQGGATANYAGNFRDATVGGSCYMQITTNASGSAGTDGLVWGLDTASPPNAYLSLKENANLYLQANSATVATLTAAGNLGVGLTSPISKLAVATASDTTNLGATGLTIGGATTLTSGNVLMLNFTPIGADSARARAGIGCEVGSDWGKGNLTFYTKNASDATALTTASERMRITTDGLVGIATTSPRTGTKLDVNGLIGGLSLEVTGNAIQGLGDAVELFQASGTGYMASIDRPNSEYNPFIIDCKNLNFRIGNTTSGGVSGRLYIDSTGASVTGQIVATNAVFGIRNNLTSTDRISVSTSATIIFSLAGAGASVGTSATLLVVNGYNVGSTTNSFFDLVLFIGGVTPVVVSSVNKGSPATRTYASSGGSAVTLTMSFGTFNVSCSSLEQAC